jgi:hypothetical protein
MKHRLSQHRSLGCSSTACNKVHRLYSSLAVSSFSVLAILASCGENPGTGGQGSGSQTGGDANSGGTTTTGGTTTGNEGNFSGENSGTGGSTTASSSSGGVAGNSVETGGRGGSGGLGGTTKGTTGTGGSSSSSGCPALTNATMAIHISLSVTWPATTGASGGSATFHAWNRTKVSTTGTSFAGKTIPCGSTVPEISLSSLIGGGKVIMEIPESFWDSQSAPEDSTSGTISGWGQDSTFTLASPPALLGLTMTDPNVAWPASYTSLTTDDIDKDGAPGLTTFPKSGSGYVNPPVSIMGTRADRVSVASRTQIDMKGAFTGCTEHSGAATAKYLDNHVVGCHVVGGSDCTATQVKFEDDNRTVYTVTSGTYVAKIVADNATCSDVRNALP